MKRVRELSSTLLNIGQTPFRDSLNAVLLAANPEAPLGDRIQWLETLMSWVRQPVANELGPSVQGSRLELLRVRFLLTFLQRNPALALQVRATIASVLLDTQVINLYSATGLGQERGFIGESLSRIAEKFIPRPVDEVDLSETFGRIFKSEDDAAWLESLDADTTTELYQQLFTDLLENPLYHLKQRGQMIEALVVLGATLASIGVKHEVRERLDYPTISESPFIKYNHALSRFASSSSEAPDYKAFYELISACRKEISQVFAKLENAGTSMDLVYRLELAQQILSRSELLFLMLEPREASERRLLINQFVAELIHDKIASSGLRGLLSNNLRLLSRKIVERTGFSGEHYIVRDRREYFSLLNSAAGGGAFTLLTVLLKLSISAAKFPLFFEGLFSALNFAGSFVAMQLLHFTLATKQPSMTASALAGKLRSLKKRQDLSAFVEEVRCITSAQFVAALGNVGMVIPVSILFSFAFAYFVKGNVVSDSQAYYILHSLNPFGGLTIFYAAFTGVLLWLSSICAGWFENWVVYRRFPDAIEQHRFLRILIGTDRSRRFAQWFSRNAAGLAGNISLGTFLAFAPVAGKFFGLPIDVRHVTLSTGQFTLAICSQGWRTLAEPLAIKSMIGIGFIGVLNFGVSFFLASMVALRARNVRQAWSFLLFKAVINRFLANPLAFLVPPKKVSA